MCMHQTRWSLCLREILVPIFWSLIQTSSTVLPLRDEKWRNKRIPTKESSQIILLLYKWRGEGPRLCFRFKLVLHYYSIGLLHHPPAQKCGFRNQEMWGMRCDSWSYFITFGYFWFIVYLNSTSFYFPLGHQYSLNWKLISISFVNVSVDVLYHAWTVNCCLLSVLIQVVTNSASRCHLCSTSQSLIVCAAVFLNDIWWYFIPRSSTPRLVKLHMNLLLHCIFYMVFLKVN